ncbi:MAG: tRNA (N6-isopentenyl adenosine(37)-C2)-methylthiotransferase MiaB [Clostridia bacterium]|nr:tRNA (N6-isopentenyl adenosine(37)-C2)-methylthiotransferase MiaB [Clostridia bacterium]
MSENISEKRINSLVPPHEMEKAFGFIRKMRALNEKRALETGTDLKAHVLTFGCQQNEADSEKLAGMARSMGYEITSEPERADLILVNTCAVREHAEQKALSIIGQFKHLKNKKSTLMIGVCGCMVTQKHRSEEIRRSYPYVDFIFGTSSLHRMPQLLYEKTVKGKRLFAPDEDEYLVAEGLNIERASDYRAWVSIMYGCNNFCSYCIVPYVRGRERSRRMEDIVTEVEELAEKGYKDITLLGQNVNSYAKGMEYDFADLLDRLAKIEGDFKLRFMTSHPKDASRKLIDTMAKHDKIAKHFHLPLQSGSDAMLKAMNRHYDKAQYLDTVRYIREKMPDIAITTDIIVGFPGETEQDFKDTLDMLREVRYDMIFSFIYSPRKGTPASEMEQIDEKVKGERFSRLLEVQNQISLEKNLPFVGKTVSVLCDGVSKNNDALLSGRTEGNKIVFFEGDATDEGKYLNIKIDRAEAFALYGEKIK